MPASATKSLLATALVAASAPTLTHAGNVTAFSAAEPWPARGNSTPPNAQYYCPDMANDFQGGAGVKFWWTQGGWHIQGPGGASSKASFDFSGGFFELDMDLHGAQGTINNNFYLVYPRQPNCGDACYCDSGNRGGCAEIDITENNGYCIQQTTWHTDPWGGEKGGHNIHQSNMWGDKAFHIRAEWTADGNTLSIHINGQTYWGEGLGDIMRQYGAVFWSSQWGPGWVPGYCPPGNINDAWFEVNNLKILGRHVQGPEPRRCSAEEIARISPDAVPALVV